MEYFIGIDIGTTSVKAVAFSREGYPLYELSVPCSTVHPFPGWSEQDPEEIYALVRRSVENILQKFAPRLPEIFGFSCAMHSLIVMDGTDQAITPALIWADNRAASHADAIHHQKKASGFYQKTGLPVHAMSPLCKILWIRENQPDVFRRAKKFIGIKEYVFHRLFGEYLMDLSMASATGLLNGQDLQWDEEILQYCTVRWEQLPSLVETSHVLYGPKDFPSLKKIPFVFGGSDGAMANIGSTGEEGSLVVTIGTSSAARLILGKRTLDESMRTFCYHIKKDQWLVGGASNNGGIVMQWLQENILCSGKTMEEFLDLGFSARPGADGLIFLPYLLGERAPLWNASAKGIFFGLRIEHRQASVIRAALEGVIYCLYSISQPLLEKAAVKQVYATGGFARNAQWVQMAADYFNLPVHLTETVENSAWGAAKWAMQATGFPVPLSGKVSKTFIPDTLKHEIYQQNNARAGRLYSLLKEEF